MSSQQLAQLLKPDGVRRALAGILSARWTTAFPVKPAGSTIEEPRRMSAAPSSIVLIADVDFLADPNSVEKLQVMNQMLIRPRNDNVSLITHAVEFLGGNRDLISIRSSGRMQRSLTKLAAIDQAALQPWQEMEAKLNGRIDTIERKISDLLAQEEGTASLLSREQEKELQSLRNAEAGLWTERRLVHDQSRWVPDNLRRLIILTHLFIVPGIYLLLDLWIRRRRQRRPIAASANEPGDSIL